MCGLIPAIAEGCLHLFVSTLQAGNGRTKVVILDQKLSTGSVSPCVRVMLC